MKRGFIKLIATGLYTGYSPIIPGTTGTVPAWLLAYFVVKDNLPPHPDRHPRDVRPVGLVGHRSREDFRPRRQERSSPTNGPGCSSRCCSYRTR